MVGKYDYAALDRAMNRLECLKLAQKAESLCYEGHLGNSVISVVLARAREYAGFVNGSPPAIAGDTSAKEPGTEDTTP